MTDPDRTAAASVPLDALIVAALDDEWCKVAVFIAKVVDAAKAQSIETSGQAIAARLYALADQGAVGVAGNIRRWRAGTVRRPTPPVPVSVPDAS